MTALQIRIASSGLSDRGPSLQRAGLKHNWLSLAGDGATIAAGGATMSKQRRIVCFSGTVQGVGFRYTAIRTARGYDVVGAVRNLPDGRVECAVEGEADEIDAFLAALGAEMGAYIRGQTQQTLPYTGAYADFNVAF